MESYKLLTYIVHVPFVDDCSGLDDGRNGSSFLIVESAITTFGN